MITQTAEKDVRHPNSAKTLIARAKREIPTFSDYHGCKLPKNDWGLIHNAVRTVKPIHWLV